MEFKEVAHLYIGCTLSHKWSSLEERTHITLSTDRLRLGTDDWIPILRKIESLNELEDRHACMLKQVKGGIIGHAECIAFLLSKHIDCFGLIDSGEAIDAATITPNPYA